MHTRRNILIAGMAVVLLTALLVPMANLLISGQEEALDTANMIEPMLNLLAVSPQYQAKTPVEPMIELEDAWAIEDTREESWEEPLVVGMRNGLSELGYDSASQTFYCTTGMDGSDDWSELELYAQAATGKENLRVAWIDDYSYDYRSDAIREGYRYELLAYTDTEYAYFGIVFTGLPIVTLHVDGGNDVLGEEYAPARAAISGAGYDAINTASLAHLRGGGFVREYPKWSFRLEFHMLTVHGDDKNPLSVLGMPADSDWILIANSADPTCARNELAWSLWRDWNADGNAFMIQQSQMVEVFLNDEYVGLYQIMQRINTETELLRMGGNLNTDYVTRVIKDLNIEKRPVLDMMDRVGYWAELRYAPLSVSAKRAFEKFEPYWQMNSFAGELTDEEFAQLAARHTDVREMMEYYLFVQAAGLGFDNVYNNVYMWALRQNGRYVYYCSPWDMDMAFTPILGGDLLNLFAEQPVRMLNLDVAKARQTLHEIWQEKRETIISDDAMYQRIQDFEDMINASGAYLRESERWHGGAQELNLAEISAYATQHLHEVDSMIEQMWPVQ